MVGLSMAQFISLRLNFPRGLLHTDHKSKERKCKVMNKSARCTDHNFPKYKIGTINIAFKWNMLAYKRIDAILCPFYATPSQMSW